MDKVIDKLNIGNDVITLYKQGISLEEIRNKLIIAHPEIPIIPSVASIYRYIQDEDGNREKLNSHQPMEENFIKVKNLFEDYYLEVNHVYNLKERKQLVDKEKRFRRALEDFHQMYRYKKQEIDDLLTEWGNILSDSMCNNCRDRVIPILIKLIEKDRDT